MQDLSKLTKDQLIHEIYEMGHIIRHMDENGEYLEYWTNDSDDDNDPLNRDRVLDVKMAFLTDRFTRDGNH